MVTIRASNAPEAITTVTTSIENTYVKISWSEPDYNSDPVLEYEILVRTSDITVFVEVEDYCDGSLPAIIANRYCHIPMSVLKDDLNLAFQAYVAVKIRSRNAIDWSAYSALNALTTQIQ